jgi:hypothetical protein
MTRFDRYMAFATVLRWAVGDRYFSPAGRQMRDWYFSRDWNRT